jgi:hypothetical protein
MQRSHNMPDHAAMPVVISRSNSGDGFCFPVLEFFNDCMVIPRTLNSLTLSANDALKTKYHNESLIVDRGGTAYRVSRAVKSERSLLNLLLPFAGFVIVDLVVTEVIPNYDLGRLKDRVLAEIARRETDGWPGDDSPDVVNDCKTFQELFQYITDGVEPKEDGAELSGGQTY